MTTSRQSAKIRRAKGTDVVNLYRLLVAELEQRPLVLVDETLALGSVLATIEKGLVVVAEHSGRIVGSIGLDILRPKYSTESLLDCEWFITVPAYKETNLGLALLKRALAIVDTYGVKVRLAHPALTDDKRIARWLKSQDFAPASTMWLRQNKKSENAPDEHSSEDGVPDSGSGSVPDQSGDGGDADESAGS